MSTARMNLVCALVLLLATCSLFPSARAGIDSEKPQAPKCHKHKRNPYGFRPWPISKNQINQSLAGPASARRSLVGSAVTSPFTVTMEYHNGPVLTNSIAVYIIWYGGWPAWKQEVIREFLRSISAPAPSPSVKDWWSILNLYTDQTGKRITGSVRIAGERWDGACSMGKRLTRLSIQTLIKNALVPNKLPGVSGTLPVDSGGGLYLVLTGEEVYMQDFCSSACGFHYFTFPSMVGHTLPYAWVGDSGKQCPGTCAYPFAVPSYMNGFVKPQKAPNGDAGLDGMISIIGHELAEIASNPFINSWYAGDTPAAPNEIGDLCEGIYGPGAGGSYSGLLLTSKTGATFNMNGANGKKFLVQWLWDPNANNCTGPNK